jgi:hypothetical protein
MTMPDPAPGESVSLAAWLDDLHEVIGPASGAAITADEQAALLDIARIAAHGSERIAAPLSTFLAGVAYGALPTGERAVALRRLAERLER